MPRAKSCFLVLAVIVALVLGFIGGLYLGGARSAISRFIPQASESSSPEPEDNEPGPIHVRFSEETLNEQLTRAVKREEVKNLLLRLQPGLIVVSGRLQKGLISSPFEAELVPLVKHGQVEVRVGKASVGKLPLPDELGVAIGNWAAHALAKEQKKVPGLVIDTVDVEAGVVEITGHINRAKAAEDKRRSE